jgi:hypothetical protein
MLESRYEAQSQENAAKPFRTMEERMSAYRREVDERGRHEVAHQVIFSDREMRRWSRGLYFCLLIRALSSATTLRVFARLSESGSWR